MSAPGEDGPWNFPQIWSRYISFENYSRKEGVKLDDFLNLWQEKMSAAQSAGCNYSDVALACKLLEKANLGRDAFQDIMTSIELSELDGSLLPLVLARLESAHSMEDRMEGSEVMDNFVKIEVLSTQDELKNSVQLKSENNLGTMKDDDFLLDADNSSSPPPDFKFHQQESNTLDDGGKSATASRSLSSSESPKSSLAVGNTTKKSTRCPLCPKCSDYLDTKIDIVPEVNGRISKKGKLVCTSCDFVLFLSKIPEKTKKPKPPRPARDPDLTYLALKEKFGTFKSTEEEPKQSRAYQCETCDKKFQRPSTLKAHQEVHEAEARGEQKGGSGEKRRFVCNECGKEFLKYNNYMSHQRSHSGEKTFVCEQCNVAFVHYFSLVYHKRKHSGERPFKCDQCLKEYYTSNKLTEHIRREHSGERPYQCDQCDQAFITSSRLKKHIMSHTGEKPFKCNICDKAFACRKSQKRHIATHARNDDMMRLAAAGPPSLPSASSQLAAPAQVPMVPPATFPMFSPAYRPLGEN